MKKVMAKEETKPQKQVQLDFSDPEVLLSVLEQIKQNKQPAIEKLMSEITDRLDKLARLGEDMILVPMSEYRELKNGPVQAVPAPVRKPRATTSTTPKAKGESAKYAAHKHCAKCNMAGHDVKSHNLAGEFKDKAFTEAELKARGYWPPAEPA